MIIKSFSISRGKFFKSHLCYSSHWAKNHASFSDMFSGANRPRTAFALLPHKAQSNFMGRQIGRNWRAFI